MSKRKIVIVAVIVAGGIAWYAFRPERLFVNQTVSESLPTAASAAAPQPISLESGSFHEGATRLQVWPRFSSFPMVGGHSGLQISQLPMVLMSMSTW